MRQTRCVRRACTGHVRRHLFFFYPYRPALRRLLLPLSSCRGRSRSKKRRRGARAREVRGRARSRVTILTVSRSCIGGATRENVVGGAGPGPSELSVCLSVTADRRLSCMYSSPPPLGGEEASPGKQGRALLSRRAARATRRTRPLPRPGELSAGGRSCGDPAAAGRREAIDGGRYRHAALAPRKACTMRP